ncbi:MAG: prolipoprotein diacylglyceryl transferase [Planctomycetes bacterium]|nr:prolipoprotein diacylglyceryl transferase [Planctomycetota bacterium]
MELFALLAEIEYPDLDPIAFKIGPLVVRWYGIAYVAGLFAGVWFLRKIARSKAYRFSENDASDFMIWTLFGIMIGGRLGSMFFYNFQALLDDPMRVFRVWEGGMAFHGGVIGVVLAIVLFTRRRKIPLLAFGDAAVCCIPPGLFFGRLANFVNGELWGRETDVAWAMRFPNDPEDLLRHPSQLYEAALEGLALMAVLWIAKATIARKLAYGFLGGLFLLGYALARSTVELFREPDAHIGFVIGEFTMGQLLSAPMILVGAWLITRSWLLRKTGDTPEKARAEALAPAS